ncbi:phosphoribosylglycinamide formyltransferase [Nakamurella alba]|uniref:phosphoribosylglycinamide formyltransferase n=1 Tax=Nakamurella alba TaxID=2665158 RepID=UPI002AC31C35|nr:phosphoribosylglycinamide formyltransferase [Nakamurella alba]
MPAQPDPSTPGPRRVAVLASGSGTLLQALLDDPAPRPYALVVVGSDVAGATALERAQRHGVPTFVHRLKDFADRAAWDAALARRCRDAGADLVVLAGFMKLLGPGFLQSFPDAVVNSHPSLLPSFPGMHAPADALAHGVKITGCTVFTVDDGVDTGAILAQRAVPVEPGDDVESLHERIKVAERRLLVEVVRDLSTTPPRRLAAGTSA